MQPIGRSSSNLEDLTMSLRSAFLSVVIIALLVSVVISQSGVRAVKKSDHVVRPNQIEGPEYGDRAYVVDKETASRIPEGLVQAILKQPRDRLEKEFQMLLANPQITYLGWSYHFERIESAGSATIATVLVTPRILRGNRSATVVASIEEVYRLENGEL